MEIDPKATLDAALRLHPDTKQVVVIAGTHVNDKGYEGTVRQAFREYENRFEFTYVSGISMEEILKRVQSLPEHTVVLYVTMFQDGTGKAFVPAVVAKMISDASNRPVYGLFDSYFGRGVVGGRLVSFELQGKKAAELGLRILRGEKPSDISFAASPNAYMFDWRQLKRWHIQESRLPAESVVAYRVATLWDTYKWQILGISFFLLCQFAFIVVLVVQRLKRRRAEEALLLTQFSVDHATEGLLRVDLKGSFLYVNDAICNQLGYTKDEFLSMGIPDINPGFPWPEFRQYMEEHRTKTFETRHQTKDGRTMPVEVRTDLVEFEGQRYIFAFIRDISERKQWEEALLSEKQRFLALVDYAPFGMTLIDREGNITYINPKFKELFGYDLDAVRTREKWFRPVFPDAKSRQDEEVVLITSPGRPGERWPETFTVTCSDSTQKMVTSIAVHLEIGELVTTYEDVTEQKRVEQEIVDSRNFLHAVLSAAPIGVSSIRNRIFEWPSESFCRMIGYGFEELREKPTRILFESDEEYERVGTVLYEQGWCETRQVRKDGSVMDCRLTSSPVDSSAFVVVCEDIYERKQLESQLLQSQKMEAIGTLAGGVAHDFNNILSVVTGYAGLLNMKMEDNEPLKAYVHHILSSAEKAVYLTQSLLAFSRKQVVDLRAVNLNEIIEKTRRILSRLIGEDIQLTTRHADENLVVLADHGQLDQILMNLATNARDAMPGGGHLVIETGFTKIDEGFMAGNDFGQPGKYATISVSDTGVGMDDKTRERIFEPFFTTKEVGKGTGLGLSTVYGIIKQHSGFIQVYSRINQGTTFNIYLPLLNMKEPEETKGPGALVGGTETILVAEDEADLRALVRTILVNVGYTVLEAVDGEDAVSRFSEYADVADLVILDVVMPKMNGKEVYNHIKRVKPEIPVLFMSGYTDDIIHQKGVYDKELNFISKPIIPVEFLTKIRQVLDSL